MKILPWSSILCIALTAILPASAAARVFQPGQSNDALVDPLTGVTLADRPELNGNIIADLLVPFSNGVSFEGTIRTQVIRETVSGTLDFYYTVSPANDLVRVSGFDNFETDVDWRVDLGKGASGVFRSPDGDSLDFAFNSGGATFVKTNATNFDLSGRFIAFPDSSDPAPPAVAVFAPTTIPLPPAVLAGAAGLALAALVNRQFRRHGV